jgi:hypothetical protein
MSARIRELSVVTDGSVPDDDGITVVSDNGASLEGSGPPEESKDALALPFLDRVTMLEAPSPDLREDLLVV